jgi:hypothetical protein
VKKRVNNSGFSDFPASAMTELQEYEEGKLELSDHRLIDILQTLHSMLIDGSGPSNLQLISYLNKYKKEHAKNFKKLNERKTRK